MTGILVIAAVVFVVLFILTELLVAVLPPIIVSTLVPPAERRDVLELLAAVDTSRRSRVVRATRLAAATRRFLSHPTDRSRSR